MNAMDFIGLFLAIHQTVNIIRYSALFAWLRDRVETGQPVIDGLLSDRINESINNFIYKVVGCPWCLSVHVAWFYLIGICGPTWMIFPVLIYALMWIAAASQAANLLHYITGHRGIRQ
jgi:hypothetical protein